MRDLKHVPGLGEETMHGPFFLEELRLDDLDRHQRIGHRLAGQQHLAHTAFAQDADDLVFADHSESAGGFGRLHHAGFEQ